MRNVLSNTESKVQASTSETINALLVQELETAMLVQFVVQ